MQGLMDLVKIDIKYLKIMKLARVTQSNFGAAERICLLNSDRDCFVSHHTKKIPYLKENDIVLMYFCKEGAVITGRLRGNRKIPFKDHNEIKIDSHISPISDKNFLTTYENWIVDVDPSEM